MANMRKPKEKKILEGTFIDSRHPNKGEYEEAQVENVEPEEVMGEEARKWLKRNQERLEEIGHVKATDLEWLVSTANLFGRIRELEKIYFSKDFELVTTTKNGYPQINPISSQLNQAQGLYLRALREGGLTPLSRESVHVPSKPPKPRAGKPGERSRQLGGA